MLGLNENLASLISVLILVFMYVRATLDWFLIQEIEDRNVWRPAPDPKLLRRILED